MERVVANYEVYETGIMKIIESKENKKLKTKNSKTVSHGNKNFFKIVL